MGQIFRLAIQQAARRTWSWVPPVMMFLTAGLLIYRGGATWESYYRNPAVLLALNIFPLVVCAGIIAGEVSSGRALLVHGLGVSRKQFIIGRLLGGAAFCWGCLLGPHLAMAAYIGWSGANFGWRASVLTIMFAGLHFAYMAAVLVLLSTLIRSWGNSAILLGLQAATAVLVDVLVSNVTDDPVRWIRLARLVVAGPLRFVVESASGVLPSTKDAVAVSALLLVYSVVATLVYQRAEIGCWVGRE